VLISRPVQLVAVLAMLSGLPDASRAAQDLPAQSLVLEREEIELRDSGSAIAERGMLVVPLKHADPAGKTIEVEVYRFRGAGSAAQARPPVFVLPGGPGFPGLGVSLARRGYYEDAIQPWTGITDLVVVGQRGIGTSKPNTACGFLSPLPIDRAVSAEERAASLRKASGQCKAKWEGDGYDLSAFNVIEAAADVDDVRRALGYDRIIVWGGSFGSHWGMAVMRFHPEIVARAILTGMEGPDHTYDMPSGVLNSLSRLAAAAEQSPQFDGQIPEGGLIAALASVIERLDSEPVNVSVMLGTSTAATQVRLDGDRIRELAYGYRGTTSSRNGMRTWPADVILLHRAEYRDAAEQIARRSLGFRALPPASFFMLDCGSGISRERHDRLSVDTAKRIVGDLGWYYDTACPVWGADLGDAFRRNFTTTIPTVIVQGTWDTSTPFENALELAPFFENSRLISVEGGSHGALREALEADSTFRAVLAHFVATGDMSQLPNEVKLPAIEWVVPQR